MASNYVEWYIQLVDSRLNRPIADSTGTCQVLTASSPVKLTIYSDANGTSQTNPVTLANGVARFYTDVATTSVDLSLITANGHAIFMAGITPSLHRCVINPDQIEQVALVAWFTTASGVVADSGVKIPLASRVIDAYLRVFTGASGSVLDVGTSSAVSGYIAQATVEITGIRFADEQLISQGILGNLLAAPFTTTLGSVVHRFYTPANALSGASVVWQNTTASSQGAGYIYLKWYRNVGA